MQPELTSFLRKANRQLRQASLVALEALLAKYGASLSTDSLDALVPEAAALLDDAGVLTREVQPENARQSAVSNRTGGLTSHSGCACVCPPCAFQSELKGL
jgi:hypothetical protein